MKTMVFGVFDGLHEGHKFFLKKAHADIVVVARDSVVRQLKHKTPKHTETERMAALRALPFPASIVLGDEHQGTYEVIKKYKPDRIVLGHDQNALEADLRAKISSGQLHSNILENVRISRSDA